MIKIVEGTRSYKKLSESKLRTFTKRDYYGYAGASKLPSGAEPKVYNGDAIDVLVSGEIDDRTVVGVSIVTEYDEYLLEFSDETRALKVANDIIKELESSGDVNQVAKKFRMKLV